MKLPGFCEKCHRVRNVRVSNKGIVMLIARNMATGICHECDQPKQPERRRQGNG